MYANVTSKSETAPTAYYGLDLRYYIVSSIKYKAVLMTEIQTANENVRQCLEYLCEKLNNVGTKLH